MLVVRLKHRMSSEASAMKQRKIFKRRNDGRNFRAFMFILGAFCLSAASFSVGMEVGRSDQTLISWVVNQAEAADISTD